MKSAITTLLFFLLIVLAVPSVLAFTNYDVSDLVSVHENCLNNSFLQITANYTVSNGTHEDTAGYNQIYECNNGCSFTLDACRPDPYKEMINALWLMGGILFFTVFSLWVAVQTGSKIDIVLISIIALFTILIGAQDTFSAMYRTILFAYAFVPLGILWVSHEVMEKDAEGEPIEIEVD